MQQSELSTPYNIFWRELRPALTAAGVAFSVYLSAIRRLKAIEGEDRGPGMGQTGYLTGVDPWKALEEYILHIRDGAAAPFWLTSAEKGK